MSEKEERWMPSGLGPRVVVSIIVFFGWLVFTILHLAFWASSFTVYQNIAIVLAALLIGIAILGSVWASWGMKFMKS